MIEMIKMLEMTEQYSEFVKGELVAMICGEEVTFHAMPITAMRTVYSIHTDGPYQYEWIKGATNRPKIEVMKYNDKYDVYWEHESIGDAATPAEFFQKVKAHIESM